VFAVMVGGCGSESGGTDDARAIADARVVDALAVVDAPVDAPVDGPVDARVFDAGPLPEGVSTLAGTGDTGSADGFRDAARFNNPANVAVGADGTIYVADFDNGRIRAVSDFGEVTTLTNQANVRRPFGLVASTTGVLYAQTDRTSALVDGGALWSIDTTTGTATLLFDNLGRARGLTELSDGRLVMAFYLEHVIKVYDPSTPAVAPVVVAGTAGMPGMVNDTGAAARFNVPYDVAAISATEVVVSDQANHRLRLVDVSSGVVSPFAGDGVPASTNGPLLSAQFNMPQGLSVDSTGNLFVSEVGGYVVRRISGGMVTTIAGNGSAGHVDSVSPLSAQFFGLEGLAVHPDGSVLYIADGNRGEADPYNRVRRMTSP
jgi:sugar lactone lactonase YvrE